MKPHFLQSEAWASFQRELGRETITKSGDGWQYMAIVEHGKLGSRLYCPYGPTVESAEALDEAISDLKTEAKKRHLDFVRVEPRGNLTKNDLENSGLKKSYKNIQPADTAISDVSVDEDEIIARAAQNNRNLWRRNLREGVKFHISYDLNDLDDFLKLLHAVAQRTGMKPFSDSYYRAVAKALFPVKSAGLMFAELNGKRIAAMLFYTDDDAVLYAHAAADNDYRKLSPGAALLFYAQIWAHDTGRQTFDFFGIAPENASPDHSWSGFTRFKLSFGGKRVTTLGTWDLPLKKFQYFVYRLVLKITGKSK